MSFDYTKDYTSLQLRINGSCLYYAGIKASEISKMNFLD